MRSMPADLRADLVVIHCATSRRGGTPCEKYPCNCQLGYEVVELGIRLMGPVARRGGPAFEAAAREWLAAARQADTEEALCRTAPREIRRIAQDLTEPTDANPTSSVTTIDDMDSLCARFRGYTPSPRLVAKAIRWVRANICPPAGGRPVRRARQTHAGATALVVLALVALVGASACSTAVQETMGPPPADTGAAVAPDASAPAPVTPKADASPPSPAPDARPPAPAADSGAPPPAPAGDASAPGQPPVCASPTGHAIYAVMVCYSAPGTPLNRQLTKDARYCEVCATQAPDLVTQEVFFGCTLDTTSRLLCVKSCTECK